MRKGRERDREAGTKRQTARFRTLKSAIVQVSYIKLFHPIYACLSIYYEQIIYTAEILLNILNILLKITRLYCSREMAGQESLYIF